MTPSDNKSASQAAASPAGHPTVVSNHLNALLAAWTASWRADLPAAIELVLAPCPQPLHSPVPAPMIRTVLDGLVQRARQSIGDRSGRIVLQARPSEPGEDTPLACDLEHPFIELSVGDNGPGSDAPWPNQAALGATLAARGGYLEVGHRTSQGSVSRILLPAVSQERAQRLRAPFPAHILMVEDEWTIATPTKLFLERAGYRVSTASDAEQAIALVHNQRPSIDLLLTDIVLPGMNGHLLLRTLRADLPDLPCLFMSGYTAESLNNLQQGLHRTLFIGKPFSSEQLLTAIHSMLAPAGVAGNLERP
ncbi:MAG TPA: response regulator [Kiritimatiellia bacterium]|nr:response regulator [Kiritimatiellia bacterium]HMP34015.1 response regulator [Kiritimatiellia bacterium]